MLRMLHPNSGAILLLAVALSLVVGCGSPPPNASVSGSVLANGKPFDGKITFSDSGSSREYKAVEVTVQGGRYEIPAISPGTKAINVISSASSADLKPSAKGHSGIWACNPRTVEIQPGSQSIDISLTDKPR